jgi:hypothetical protein
MAITVKKVQLLRCLLQNRPGALAESLKPFAEGGVNLQVIMGYVYQKDKRHAELEICGAKANTAAAKGKFESAKRVHCLLVQGDDRPGLGYDIARALGSSRINMSFALMQAVGRRYSAVFGFETGASATRAMRVIKAAGSSRKASGHARQTRGQNSKRRTATRSKVARPRKLHRKTKKR